METQLAVMDTIKDTIKDSTKELMARIQRDHPYTEDEYEMAVYKSELTNDEANLYMAWSIWQTKDELEKGKLQNRKAFLELTKDIDWGHFKWVKGWLREFHKIKDAHNHLNLILEFHSNHHWSCHEYERLRDYKEKILNAYLNIKKSEKSKENLMDEFSAYK
ncbi:MAG: hypothetical protein ACYDIA_01915 [Candidatus Humimicrobiaceae bacterium]